MTEGGGVASRRLREKFSQKKSYPSVCEPVCRVSDEEVFWASMAARPRAARKPLRAKNRRSRGWRETRKTPEVIANKGRIQNRTLPTVWRGMWRGLKVWIFVKDSSNFLQEAPPD
jgi:hypothetical protein